MKVNDKINRVGKNQNFSSEAISCHRHNKAFVKIIGVFLMAVAFLFPTYAEEKFTSEALGISIDPPTQAGLKCSGYLVATFCLPPESGFAANVNIIKQSYNQPINAFDKLSLSQFKSLNAKVLMHTLKGNEALYEYILNKGGKKLHFYARAVKQDNYVYCITATALDENWKTQKTVLIKSVSSFNVLK